eukprot:scaffold88647_cov45-Phaeocystis_antarctica.AAC.1
MPNHAPYSVRVRPAPQAPPAPLTPLIPPAPPAVPRLPPAAVAAAVAASVAAAVAAAVAASLAAAVAASLAACAKAPSASRRCVSAARPGKAVLTKARPDRLRASPRSSSSTGKQSKYNIRVELGIVSLPGGSACSDNRSSARQARPSPSRRRVLLSAARPTVRAPPPTISNTWRTCLGLGVAISNTWRTAAPPATSAPGAPGAPGAAWAAAGAMLEAGMYPAQPPPGAGGAAAPPHAA